MKWAKVDQTGRIVDIVDSDQTPAHETGFTFHEDTTGQLKVGDAFRGDGGASGASAGQAQGGQPGKSPQGGAGADRPSSR